MIKRTGFLVFCFYLFFTLNGCKQKPSEAVPLHRLEKVLFDTPQDQLQSKLLDRREEFRTDLLTLRPDDGEFMQQLYGFVDDPVVRQIYQLVDSVFGDMKEESVAIGTALMRARELYPVLRYDKVYTYISTTFDYDRRVGCNSHELIISIDQYVLPYTQRFNYFGTPLYLVRQSQRKYIPVDCMTAIAREKIALPDETPSLLDYMVAEGKALWFAKQTLDNPHDSLLLRYSDEQYGWMTENEENVWSYLLQNKLLFETDYMRFHNLIDEAPKTNAFGSGTGSAFTSSAPRTTNYLGLAIVSRYMKNSGSSVEQLFKETNAQKILNESNYRPGR